MAYTKHNFKSGDRLYAAQLNEMEDQIAANETAAEAAAAASGAGAVKNLMNNLLYPFNPNAGNAGLPAINGIAETAKTGKVSFEAATHGFRVRAEAANIFGFCWYDASGRLAELEPGETYTFSADVEAKLFQAEAPQTRYLLIFYVEKTLAGSLPKIKDTKTSNAKSYASLLTYQPEEKGNVKTAHIDFPFTVGADAGKFSLVIKPYSEKASEITAGDYFELKNIMLCKGNVTSPVWQASDDDILYARDTRRMMDIVERNDPTETVEKLIEMKRKTRINQDSFGTEPLCLLHFSDIHGDTDCLRNIVRFADNYSLYIDDILHTGDSVYYYDGDEDSFLFWDTVDGSERILNCIGNHDTCVKNVGWAGLSMQEAYDKYFKPYLEHQTSAEQDSQTVEVTENLWGENVSFTSGKTYYYKDYPTQKVRLVVLDIMHQTAEQLAWFTQALEGARTAGLHVIAAVHGAAGWEFDGYESAWNLLGAHYRFPGGDSSGATSTYPGNIADAYPSAVDAFLDAGGSFVCWLHGHTHFRIFARLSMHPRQLNVAVANAGGQSYAKTREWGKEPLTKTMDDFNVLAVDTYAHILRLMKVGVSYDRLMRKADTISYNYETGELLWGTNPTAALNSLRSALSTGLTSLGDALSGDAAAAVEALVSAIDKLG